MKKLIHLFLLMVFCTLRVMAQGSFVYTNNDRLLTPSPGFPRLPTVS